MEDLTDHPKNFYISNCHYLRPNLSAAGHKISHHLFLLKHDKANGILDQIHYTVVGSIPIETSSSMLFFVIDGIIHILKISRKTSSYKILLSDLLQ